MPQKKGLRGEPLMVYVETSTKEWLRKRAEEREDSMAKVAAQLIRAGIAVVEKEEAGPQ